MGHTFHETLSGSTTGSYLKYSNEHLEMPLVLLHHEECWDKRQVGASGHEKSYEANEEIHGLSTMHQFHHVCTQSKERLQELRATCSTNSYDEVNNLV